MGCTIKSCLRKYYAKNFCQKHYDNLRRRGDPLAEPVLEKQLPCAAPGCGSLRHANGLCNKHLQRKRRENPTYRTKEYVQLKAWRQANPEKLAAQQARKYVRQKDALNAYCAQWKKDNRESYNAYLAQRKKRVRQATPPWADMSAIRAFYEACPKGYHVDHIIPLNGKNVSGLHTVENLQYLPAVENLKKSNKVP